MIILCEKISRAELKEIASHIYGDMVKAVADIEKGLLAIDAEMHADLERALLENGSEQKDLWGFNLYPEDEGEDFIEFDSIINIRSWQGNPTRDVLDATVRQKIVEIVAAFIGE